MFKACRFYRVGVTTRLGLIAAGLVLLPFGLLGQTSTTTTLASITPVSPVFGQTVTLTATVSPAFSAGSVAFMDGVQLVGTGNLNAGVARATTVTLSAGAHLLRAVYGGSGGTILPSQSTTVGYSVTAVSGTGFSSTTSPGTGSGPFAVAVGDFNGDGRADLAVANNGSNSVTILLGNGGGTFVVASSPSTGSSPRAIAVGDFNGDGRLDLAVANQFSNTVSILLGNGDGTFFATASPGTGSQPRAIAVGDFNKDGRADLAVANIGSNAVSILLGNGDGTFVLAALPSTGVSPWSVAIGDFNSDGNADLAVANAGSNSVSILLGHGNGTFTATTSPNTGTNPQSVVVGDFNGDGLPDLAVANAGSNSVSILLGIGNGTFSATSSPGTGTQPVSMAVGDFNGDGRTDLAVANSGSSSASILLGNGNGTFSAAASPGTGSNPLSVAVGDFNGDGAEDLAVANNNSSTVSILLGQTGISSSTTVTNTNDSGPGSLRAAIASAGSGGTVNFSLAYPATIVLASTLTIGANVTINGPGAGNLAIDGDGSVGVFQINAGVIASFSGVTIQDGNATNGGGIFNSGTLTLSNVVVTFNSANFQGGGIANTGTLTMTNCTVSENDVNHDGGGIANGGTLTLTQSTISDNIADLGGGIYNFVGTATITNSTLVENGAFTAGGGLIIPGGGTATLVNVTMFDNSSEGTGGSISYTSGALTLKNTLLSSGFPSNCSGSGTTITSYGHNLSDDGTCFGVLAGVGDLNNTIAGLDPNGLQNNGGPTQTIALVANSPAVDAIPLTPVNYCTAADGVTPINNDQRGFVRPFGSGCDIGAFEFGSGSTTPSLTISKTHFGNFPPGGQGQTYTITVSNAGGSGPTSGTVFVTDTVPSGLTLVGMAGSGWACAGATCTRGDALSGGLSYPPITVTVNVAPGATSPQNNVATVTGGGSATASATDSTQILIQPILVITKIHAGNPIQGQQVIYTVTVLNTTGAGATNGTVTVTEAPPVGLTIVSMVGSGWTCGVNTCSRSDVLPGSSIYPPIIVTANIAVNAPTPLTNRVTVSGGGSQPASASDPTLITPLNCTFSLSSFGAHVGNGSQQYVDTNPSTGEFLRALTGTVTLSATSCGANDTWTATSNNQPILAMQSGPFTFGTVPVYSLSGTGVGNTTIGFAMFANTTSHARNASITISGTQAGQPFTLTFTVNQDASSDTQLQRVVRALYQTILGREPDFSGFNFWTGTGAPMSSTGVVLVNQMADGFYTSPEFGSNGWETLSLFQALLGRLPAFKDWLAITTPLRPGTATNTEQEVLVDQITASTEYQLRAGGPVNNANFVQQTIQNAWGRQPTSDELNTYVTQLNNSFSSTARADFLNQTIFANQSFQVLTNPLWVSMLYYTILVRDPDPAGFNFWLSGATNPPGQQGIYYVSPSSSSVYAWKLSIIGQAVPPNPALLGFLGSPEFQGLIQ